MGGKAGIWSYLWALPQAVAWEELRLVRTVARYSLVLGLGEKPGASPALLAELRQLEDRLGLNPLAMRRLLWEVTDQAGKVVEEDEQGRPVASLEAYRQRSG